ncbi:MAG TPA: neutral/alkaline non-lysosomal ceramidase N-terminal domain-containing protein [bacterium]|nr:neutral/alkaline non-lysosomal ceramidase N-terminal domain-containing protein [bacterium]
MQEEIMAGVSKINITPPLGYRLQGHSTRNKPSEKVHDPLYMKVLTVRKGDDRAVIITSDLLGLSMDFVSKARAEIEKKTGIMPHQVLLCSSHTHSGPFVLPPPDGKLNENFIPDYLSLLVKQAAGAVSEALKKEEKVRLIYGKNEVNIGSINRRRKNPDGSIGGPDPCGPVDREVTALSFEKSPGNPVAILFNYGCHPTTVSNTIYDITAEYPGAAQYELEKFYPGTTALFTNGCSGDVRPALLNEEKTQFRAGDFEDVRRMGRLLAAGAIEAIETARRETGAEGLEIEKVSACLETFHFPLDRKFMPTDERQIEENLPVLVQKLRGNRTPLEPEIKWMELWKEKLRKGEKAPSAVEADLQVIKIGPVALIAFPGDTMSEIGLKIKKRLPYAVPVSNSNGRIGYIPSAQGLKDGGYEASFFFFQGFAGPYAPTMEKKLLEKVFELTGK